MITAIVLAAGSSRRMGRPKIALPWGQTTVLGQVLGVLGASGVDQILVVTSGQDTAIEAICRRASVQTVATAEFEAGEMLSSRQAGLRAAPIACSAALIVLGDQPMVEPAVIQAVLSTYNKDGASLVVPSYQHRRGHPWLVGREWWVELLRR